MIERLDFFYTHIRVFSGMRVTYFYVRGSMVTHFGKICGVRGAGCRRPSKAVFECYPVNPDLSQCQRRCSGAAQQRTCVDAGVTTVRRTCGPVTHLIYEAVFLCSCRGRDAVTLCGSSVRPCFWLSSGDAVSDLTGSCAENICFL